MLQVVVGLEGLVLERCGAKGWPGDMGLPQLKTPPDQRCLLQTKPSPRGTAGLSPGGDKQLLLLTSPSRATTQM